MAKVPTLQVSGLPAANQEETSAAVSPARGREMRHALLSKLRAPFTHSWDLWHDRLSRTAPSSQTPNPSAPGTDGTPEYDYRLKHMYAISDVKAFWSTINNLDMPALPLNDSIHLFHRGVKPVREDPRNVRGGCWTFCVQEDKAKAFWTEICMMAILETLQDAVRSNRPSFNDDICGVSYSVRSDGIFIQIWNRDAAHAEGVANLLETVRSGMPPDLKPQDGSFFYEAHSDNAEAGAVGNQVTPPGPKMPPNALNDPNVTHARDLKAAEPTGAAAVDVNQPPKGTYPTSIGSGVNQQREVMQDVEDTLSAMKTAMDIVGQKSVDHEANQAARHMK